MGIGESIEAVDAPGPVGLALRESTERYVENSLAESMRLFREFGDVVALRRGPFTTIFLFHPDHAKHVLVKAADNYSRQTAPAKKLKAALGDGIITSDKPEWTRQRKLAQPAFTKKAIDRGVPMFNQVARELVATLRKDGQTEAIDVHHRGGVALLNLVGRLLLSESFGQDKGDRLRSSLNDIARLRVVPSAESILFAESAGQGKQQFESQHSEFLEKRAILDEELDRLVAERRASPGRDDMLSSLLDERDEDGLGFSDFEVREQIKGLVIAGHDTTMTALSVSLYYLAKHPACLAKVRREVEAVVGNGEVLPDHLDRLLYTEAVVAETLRLCPSVAHIDRRAEVDDVLGGFRIPRGASVALCPYVVQRREDVWESPEAFMPERFLGKPPSAYFPFSLGPRTCLGRALSILEVKLFLAHILRELELRVPEGFELELETNWTVHPKGAVLPLWVRPR